MPWSPPPTYCATNALGPNSVKPPLFSLSVRAQRGSVLVVALLVAALIALALGSYLSLSGTSARFARRTYFHDAALHLAEAGAEEALWAFNQAVAGEENAWNDWKLEDPSAWREFTDFALGSGIAVSVKVYVENTAPPGGMRPKIAALASVAAAGEPPVTRMLELKLQRRSPFAGGLVARNEISFAGSKTSVDSWDSDPDRDPVTAPVAYTPARSLDHGSVSSAEVENQAVLLNQADVWGYVATGGPLPKVGSNGSIRGSDTPADVVIDESRIATDFNASFPAVKAPPDGTTLAKITGPTLGTDGFATRWRCSNLILKGSDTLTILGDVTLVLTAGSGSTALSVTGNASIVIPVGSSLTLYTEGDIKIAGQGFANGNVQPISFQIWGTYANDSSRQDIQVAGNGSLKAVIYAPNALVSLNGNGDMMGSVVAQDIKLTGNAAFHYDEALAYYGSDIAFGVAAWSPINEASERTAYEALFSQLPFE